MDDVELYSKYHGMQTHEVKFVLENYMKTLQWKSGETILDVGTASGEVTTQMLAPLLPQDFEKVVGLDILPNMVSEAKRRNKNPKIDFVVNDISSEDMTDTIEDRFDHIFSFLCLHWIQDQKQTFKNIYKLLKPGGEILLLFVAKSAILDVYESMATYPKWSSMLADTKKYISPYHHCEDPKAVLEKLLVDEGFEVKKCRVEKRSSTFSELSDLKLTLRAINPFINKMPEDVQPSYIDDLMKEFYNFQFFTRLENRELVYNIPHELFIVHASIP